MSTCERRAEWLDAWRAGRLEEELARRGPPCEVCAQALATAALSAAGQLEEVSGMDDDAVALAAVGLGEVELEDAEDAAWLAALSDAPAGELPPAPDAPAAPAEGAALVGQRREASVLFRIEDLVALSAAAPATAPATLEPEPPDALAPMAPTPLVTARPAAGGGRWGLVVGGLAVAAAAIGLTFVLVRAPAGEAPVPAAPSPAAATPASGAPAAADARPRAAVAGDEAKDDEAKDDEAKGDEAKGDAAKGAAKPAAAKRRTRRSPARAAAPVDAAPAAAPAPARRAPTPPPARRAPARSAKKDADEVDDLLGALDGSKGGGAKRAAAPAARPAAPAADPLLPASLSRQQILGVVKRNAGAIRACRDGDTSGTVMVALIIAGSGQVSAADVTTGKFKDTPVGRCVEGKVRAFRFPAFRGDPMRLNLPFAL